MEVFSVSRRDKRGAGFVRGSSLSSSASILLRFLIFCLVVVTASYSLQWREVGALQSPVGRRSSATDRPVDYDDHSVVGSPPALSTDRFGLPTEGEGRWLSSTSATASIVLLDTELFVLGSGKLVLSHDLYAAAPFANYSQNGSAIIRNLVSSPNSTELFYILDERIQNGNTRIQVVSFRRADLSVRLKQGAMESAEESAEESAAEEGEGEGEVVGKLISYWWPYDKPNGTVVSAPVSAQSDSQNAIMSLTWGMDLTKLGSHLLLTTEIFPQDKNKPSRLCLLSIADGNRTSIPFAASRLGDMTLNPAKNIALMVDNSADFPRLLSAKVTESGVVINQNLDTAITFRDSSKIPWLTVSAQGLASDGRCLYFLSGPDNSAKVIGLPIYDPSPSTPTVIAGNSTPTVIAGNSTPIPGPAGDGPALNALLRYPRDIVATPDGCNIFVSDNGSLRWVTVESPCKTGAMVKTVAIMEGSSFRGLRLHSYGDRLYLFAGSQHGHLFQLEINKAKLHVCAPFSADSSSPDSGRGVRDPSSSSPSRDPRLTVSLAIAAAVVVAALVGGLFLFRRRRHRNASARGGGDLATTMNGSWVTMPPHSWVVSSHAVESSAGSGSRYHSGLDPISIKQFPLAALQHCTDDFSSDYRIGESGAFGDVYWGWIDGQDLAIKVMTGELSESKRKQFLAELNTLTRLRHANLVPLVGYCHEGNRSILVYPYFAGGSLHARLHDRERAIPGRADLPPLTLAERMSVALQVAKGLSYLHTGANPPIIHRDVKSSNVLLDGGSGEGLVAVVADFGLAAIGERLFGTEHQQKRLADTMSYVGGTFGYMAPEYVLEGKLSEKNDVYAFGVIILELLTGRRAVEPSSCGVGWEALANRVEPFLEVVGDGGDDGGDGGGDGERPNHYEILDSCLRDEVGRRGSSADRMVMGMLRLAWACLQPSEIKRPSSMAVRDSIRNLLAEWRENMRNATSFADYGASGDD